MAARCLPALCEDPRVQVNRVILSHGVTPNRKRLWYGKLRKMLRIGPLGAINGVRMRKWYKDQTSGDLFELARSRDVPVFESAFTNSDETRRLFRDADVELGLSLGNGYIPASVFDIPTHGMINVHTEILPRFQGAQGIIWAIYEGVCEVGFTIHQIDKHIDGGDILFQEVLPMLLYPTLRETVEQNMERIRRRVPQAVCGVCANYPEFNANARRQTSGTRYTTPTLWQFLRMVFNHRRLYRETWGQADTRH